MLPWFRRSPQKKTCFIIPPRERTYYVKVKTKRSSLWALCPDRQIRKLFAFRIMPGLPLNAQPSMAIIWENIWRHGVPLSMPLRTHSLDLRQKSKEIWVAERFCDRAAVANLEYGNAATRNSYMYRSCKDSTSYINPKLKEHSTLTRRI